MTPKKSPQLPSKPRILLDAFSQLRDKYASRSTITGPVIKCKREEQSKGEREKKRASKSERVKNRENKCEKRKNRVSKGERKKSGVGKCEGEKDIVRKCMRNKSNRVRTIDAFSLVLVLIIDYYRFACICTIVAQIVILSCFRPLLISILVKNGA